LSGLPSFISDNIQYDDPKTLEETIRRSKCLYDQHRGRPTYQKAWEENNKINMEKRKKGTNPPFFINNFQGHPTPKESRMTEEMGKRPRKKTNEVLGL
jgi:hypothetical protein